MRTTHRPSRPLTCLVPSLLLLGLSAGGLLAADPTITVFGGSSALGVGVAAPTLASAGSAGTLANPVVVFQFPNDVFGFDPSTSFRGTDDVLFQINDTIGNATAVTIASTDVQWISASKVAVRIPTALTNGKTLRVYMPANCLRDAGTNGAGNTEVFNGTADKTITTLTAAIASNVLTATLTTSAAHGLAVGDFVNLVGCTPAWLNGLRKVTAVGSSTTFSFVPDVAPADISIIDSTAATTGDLASSISATGSVVFPKTIYTFLSAGQEIQSQLAIVTPIDDSQTTDRQPTVSVTAAVNLATKSVSVDAGASGATGTGATAGSVTSSSLAITITYLDPVAPAQPPNFTVGDTVTVSGVNSSVGNCNGTFVLTGATHSGNGGTITYSLPTGSTAPVMGTNGTVSHNVLVTTVDKFSATDLYTLELRENATFSVASGGIVSDASSVATATFTRPHGLKVGDLITVASSGVAGLNVSGVAVLSVPSALTLTYQSTAATGTSSSTATVTADALRGTTTFQRGNSSTIPTIQVKPATSLAVGKHNLFAKVKDPIGNYVQFSGTTAVAPAVDLLIWDPATVVNPGLVNGVLVYDKKSALDLTGAKFGEPASTGVSPNNGAVGSDLTITVDGQPMTVKLDSTPTNLDAANTNWYTQVPASIMATPGIHTVVLTQTANNGAAIGTAPTGFATAPSINTTFTIDNSTSNLDVTAPDIPTISTPTDAQTVFTQTPTITGDAEVGSTITLQFSTDNVNFTTVGVSRNKTNASGKWTFDATDWGNAAVVANRTIAIDTTTFLRVTASDSAGNISQNSSAVSVLVPADNITPAISGTVGGAVSRTNVPGGLDGDYFNGNTLLVRVALTKRSGATVQPDAGTLTASDFTVTGGTLAAKTVAVAASALAVSSNVATATVAAGHGIVAGDRILVSGASVAAMNGEFTVASVTGTTIVYNVTTANASSSSAVTITGVSVYVVTPSASPVTVTLPASKLTSTVSSVAYDNLAASYTFFSDKVAPTVTPTIVSGTSTTAVNGSPNLVLTFLEPIFSFDTTKIALVGVGGTPAVTASGTFPATGDDLISAPFTNASGVKVLRVGGNIANGFWDLNRKVLTLPITMNSATSISTAAATLAGSTGIQTAMATDYAGNTSTFVASAIAAKTVDTTNPSTPTITSTISAATATKTSPIPFTITFPEAVVWDGNGLEVVNGVAGAVTGTGAVYTVNVTPGEGIVKIRLNAASYKDLVGNAVTNQTISFVTRTFDSTTPRIVNMASSAKATTKLTDIPFTVSFSEAVSGLSTADFVTENCDILTTGGVAGVVPAPSGQSLPLATYSLIARVKAAKVGQAGVKVRVLLPAGTVQDGATNLNSSIGELVRTYDGLIPVLTAVPTPTATAHSSTVFWDLVYNKTVTFDISKVQVTGGTVFSATGSGTNTIRLTVNYPKGTGAVVGVTLQGGAAVDAAGNASAVDSTSVTFTADNSG